MAVWTEMSTGARVAAVAGGAAVLALLGYFSWEPATVENVAGPVAEVAAPIAPAPAPAAQPQPIAPSQTDPQPIAPALDVVRVAPDGGSTVAGTAEPGATVSLRVDGAEVLQVIADASGNFVALFDLVASELPRLLTVVAIGADGAEIAGRDSVALAPILPKLADASEPLPAPTAIMVSPEGVKVLQPATEVPAEVAANVFVDTIAYTADGAVQLGGHGQAGGALRVYLDADAVADTTVAADGTWSLVLRDVAPGLYQLRVDQLAADGTVTSRFETPFKRETLQALAETSAAAAQPAAPAAVTVDSTAPQVEPAATATATTDADAPKVAANDPAPVATAVEPVPSEAAASGRPSPAGLVSVTVQPGFTLWGIAKKEFGEGVLYVQVFDANREKIKNPDLIYPGQIFLIPGKN